MKYLLDTCVVSELINRRPAENVVSWFQNCDEEDLYVGVLTFGELEKGIEKAPDISRKRKSQMWIEHDLKERFKNKIIDVDLEVATVWGRIQGQSELQGKPMPAIDGLIAVSGLVHDCIVVTRNISDMQSSGAVLVNPWV